MAGLDKLCLNDEEGLVRDRAAIEGPRTWPVGFAAVEPEVEGRDETPLAVRDCRDLGMPGVAKGLEILADLSEKGGDGGVGVSDNDDFAGGVSKVGEEAVVVVGDSSDLGDAETAIGRKVKFLSRRLEPCSVAFCSFSFVMSASILRSDSSSRSRWASILRASLSCSLERISPSSRTPRSMV